MLNFRFLLTRSLIRVSGWLVLCLWLPTLACSSLSNADGLSNYPIRELHWFNNSTVLLYGRDQEQQWLLNATSFKLIELPFRTKEFRVSVSETGENIVVYDSQGFRFGPVVGPLSSSIDIPVWLKVPESSNRSPGDYWIFNQEVQMAWISNNKILVNQRNRETGKTACKIFNTNQSSWEDTQYCIDSNYNINRLQYNVSRNQMVVYQSVEGAPIVSKLYWESSKEPQQTSFPELDLLYGVLYVHFIQSPNQFGLTTPCDFERKGERRACDGGDMFTQPWRYYVWDESNKTLTLINPKIPPYAVPNPENDKQFVWQEGRKVCMGVPGQNSSKCKTIP